MREATYAQPTAIANTAEASRSQLSAAGKRRRNGPELARRSDSASPDFLSGTDTLLGCLQFPLILTAGRAGWEVSTALCGGRFFVDIVVLDQIDRSGMRPRGATGGFINTPRVRRVPGCQSVPKTI